MIHVAVALAFLFEDTRWPSTAIHAQIRLGCALGNMLLRRGLAVWLGWQRSVLPTLAIILSCR